MASSPPISHVSDSENSRSSFDSSSYIGGDSSSVLKAKDVCEELLGNKMIAIELNEGTSSCVKDIHHCDGSDSGLDIATTLNLCLKRALSSNSGDYASSNGGLDIESNINDNISCGSSMISCASDLGGENKSLNTTFSQKFNCEYCSENGSESSLVTNEDKLKKPSSIKKKIGMFEPASLKTVWKAESSTLSTAGQLNKVKSRLTTISQTKSGCPQLLSREGARPREKVEKSLSEAVSKSNTPSSRSTPQRRTPKPNSLPCALTSTLTLQRCSQRTPSVTRARTPGTPSDDGRWPSVGSKITVMGISAKRGSSVTPDLGSIKIRGQTSLDSKGLLSSGNCSNTLPRRRKQKSVEDLRDRASRSSSNSRDNGMVSSITVSSRKSIMSTYCTPSKIGSYRKTTSKTRIFHEMGVQTVITGQDVEKSFTGDLCRCVQIHSVQLMEKQTQSEIRDMEMEYLREEVQRLLKKQSEISSKLEEKTQKISQMEQQISKEREEKISVQRELNQNTERVIGMLELAKRTPSGEESCDSLMMLESQIQMSGHELVEKTQEVFKLRKLCRTLQIELERALTAQECLIQEKNSIEREAIEMQDFLQHEKTAMCDALNESESEYQQCKKKLVEKEEEIKVLRDECRHLVRLNEQRRQENKLMQSKYTVLESKSKDLRHHQNAAVSGASMALSGLYTRLDSLVEQLIASYNISEQDLEDIVYHNEAYPNSASSCDETPDYENNTDGTKAEQNDGSLSPQRNQSFIAAVISAIRNATVPSGKKLRSLNTKPVENINGESDSTEMLDSETEPCLMMDNVLEDVTMPDSHSHNLVSSTGIVVSQIELPPDLVHVGDESLHNLSQAITNRQQIELEINSTGANAIAQFGKNVENSLCEDISFHESVAEMPSIAEYCSTQALIDQVIGVDNLITKLLKVLRLIQMDNDVCIQQLIVDKNKLQQNKEDMLEKLKDLQDVNIKLQDELMDATQELMLKRNDLSTTKADIQRHRNEIDRLNEDICQLSTLCSQNNSQCNSLEQDVAPEDLLRLLRTWNEQGYFAEINIKNYLTTLCFENFKESNITYDSQQKSNNILDENSVQEIRRQYETIDNALNILYKLQNIVQDNPTLQQLQNELEKANNQSTNKLSLYSAVIRSSPNTSQDLINANDSKVILENCCDNLENQTQINSPV